MVRTRKPPADACTRLNKHNFGRSKVREASLHNGWVSVRKRCDWCKQWIEIEQRRETSR